MTPPVCYYDCDGLINSKLLNPFPPGNSWAFDWCLCIENREFDKRWGGGGFEPCQSGVGNLNWKCQVFPVEYTCLFFDVVESKVKSLLSQFS